MEYQFVKPPQVFLEAMPASTLINSTQSVIHNDIFRFAFPTGSSVLLISSEKLPPIPIDADEFNLDSERFYLPSGDLALITTNVGINLGALADDAASVLQAQAVSMLGTSDVDVFDISQLGSWRSQALKNWNLINTSEIDTLLSTVELVDGKEGIDTIKIDRDYASGDFKLERVDESTFVITAPKYSYNPMMVKNVEQIEFNNKLVVLSEIVGKAYRLYQAAFARTPDNGGLKYWINTMDAGHSLEAVAGGFIASAEFQSLYGDNPSNEVFVTKLYNNVLGRAPEQGGFDYWVGLLNDQKISKVSTLINFSESDENQLNVIGVIENGIELFL